MSATPVQEHTQRLVASVYGWRTYQSWCDCCTPEAAAADNVAKPSLRPRSKPASPVLAWRTRLAVQAETINPDDSTSV